MKRCGRCQAAILSSELVMRARELVFHVHCFTCAVCSSLLTKGDTFGMRDGAVFCRLHYSELPPLSPYHGAQQNDPSGPHFPHGPEFHPRLGPHPTPPLALPPPQSVNPDTVKMANTFFNGAPPAPRQKGRPRKRKPKDLEGMTANLGQ
ncbi:hypothetical protein O3M35_002325 [Rhynocoris fuscipes]|uniref:LIM zinc-binding domain-containing protein n=1 Tax=Rhynocoris fuscipes TaxID=488301 RepID=A0AAW1CLH1_9HEMI